MTAKFGKRFLVWHSLLSGASSQRPGAVKGAGGARRSEPLTARTAAKPWRGEGKAACGGNDDE